MCHRIPFGARDRAQGAVLERTDWNGAERTPSGLKQWDWPSRSSTRAAMAPSPADLVAAIKRKQPIVAWSWEPYWIPALVSGRVRHLAGI